MYFKIYNNITTVIAALCLSVREIIVHTIQDNLGVSIEDRRPLDSTQTSSNNKSSKF